jgi:hypothetical protein
VALWDVLFGTVHLPHGRRPQRYGVDERMPAGWVGRFFHPFHARPEAPAERTRSAGERAEGAAQVVPFVAGHLHR